MKRCCRCKETKPETAFSKAKSKADGLQSSCRECQRMAKAKARQHGLAPGDQRHGTLNGYTAYACRCELCREAAVTAYKSRIQRGLESNDPKHGTKAGYDTWGCRCGLCRAAKANDRKGRKRRGLAPDDERHGTKTGYDEWACRCQPCVDAMATYVRFRTYEWSNEAEAAFHLAQACDLCHGLFNSNKRDTAKAVDHDHVHGFVRGVIHSRCNINLNDKDRDTIQMLEDALAAGDHQTANYLLKSVQTV